MKKVLKIVITIICWVMGILLLWETIKSFRYLDPWGLGFAFYTLPIGIVSMLFLLEALILTKELVAEKKK